MFRITIDDSDLRHFKDLIRKELSEGEAENAVKAAYLRAVRTMRQGVSDEIRKHYKVREKDVRAAIKVGYKGESAVLTLESPRLSISEQFKFRPHKRPKKRTKTGRISKSYQRLITADIVTTGPTPAHRRAFIAGYKRGKPGIYWHDEGAPREEVRLYKTLSIPQMMTARAAEGIEKRAHDVLEERLRHELSVRLDRIAKGMSWSDYRRQ